MRIYTVNMNMGGFCQSMMKAMKQFKITLICLQSRYFFFAIQNKISSILISIHEILWRVLLLLNFFPNNLHRLFLDVSSRIRVKKQVGSKYKSARNMKVFEKLIRFFIQRIPSCFWFYHKVMKKSKKNRWTWVLFLTLSDGLTICAPLIATTFP